MYTPAVAATDVAITQPPTAPPGSVRAELQGLTVKDLRVQAAAAGVPDNVIEDARDSNDPRSALVELIVNARSQQP